ncbi:copper resistance CopC family protein [Geomesophilobacter sediminis]|uniref:Copper resistance protein CopC n=1 Tax=Geomesophilobacter sediminis TaxID=2798584 RepID=A0A8J7IR73_9BACT|nr:copper resistance protein CopC [Geomesophilobacter sediminis]MBJ6725329.1 copper resistance protein CopC [Geomesophilobacter sediminis]
MISTRCRGWLVSALILVALAAPGTVWAHCFPERSEPKVGATVNAPQMVRIWFDGALEAGFSTLMVKDHNGKRVDKGDGHVDAKDKKLLEIGVPPLKPDTYHVYWKVVSRDGHRTTGDFPFTVR